MIGRQGLRTTTARRTRTSSPIFWKGGPKLKPNHGRPLVPSGICKRIWQQTQKLHGRTYNEQILHCRQTNKVFELDVLANCRSRLVVDNIIYWKWRAVIERFCFVLIAQGRKVANIVKIIQGKKLCEHCIVFVVGGQYHILSCIRLNSIRLNS